MDLRVVSVLVVGAASLSFVPARMAVGQDVIPLTTNASEVLNLGLRGVYFVPNEGQWSDASVYYGLKSRGLDVAFRESSFTMHLSRECGATSSAGEEAGVAPSLGSAGEGRGGGESLQHGDYETIFNLERQARRPHDRSALHEPVEDEHLTLTVSFPGSNPITPRGAQPQTAKFNYFAGGEGRGTASNVPSFGALVYEDLYDGIDLYVCGSDDGVMKYEFHCESGADYTQIRIHYDGIDSLCVNDDGDLEIATSFGTLVDGAPLVWQEEAGGSGVPPVRAGNGETAVPAVRLESGGSVVPPVDRSPAAANGRDARSTIPARFELTDARTYRIVLDGPVDPARAIVIDPEVEWMLYLGGDDYDWVNSIAVGADGDTVGTGYTGSVDFDGRNNVHHGGSSWFGWDAFVVRVGPSGPLEWMTFLGGSEDDWGFDILVTGSGATLVTGYTDSPDFEGSRNSPRGGTDGFVAEVSAVGQLQWMSYLGGSNSDTSEGMGLDSAGNVLLTGSTSSRDFEHRLNSFHGGLNDAFAAKVSPSGDVIWMLYLGGSQSSEKPFSLGRAVCADSENALLVVGLTTCSDFEGRRNSFHGGYYDGFLLKTSSAGELQWMRFLGGRGALDSAEDVTVDELDNALVVGSTNSSDFEGAVNSRHGSDDSYLLKSSPTGEIAWMMYHGGSAGDQGSAISMRSSGNLLICGGTISTDFEGRENSSIGHRDAFLMECTPDGNVSWMRYLGGTDSDYAEALATDTGGNALVAGYTKSTDFYGRVNSHHGGDNDAFIARVRLTDGPQLGLSATCPSGGPMRIEWSGASPGGQVALIFARNTGSFIVPNNYPCAGTQLGLGASQIQLAWQGGAGGDGSRTLNANAGPGACGGYLQLLDLTTCTTSNVVQIE